MDVLNNVNILLQHTTSNNVFHIVTLSSLPRVIQHWVQSTKKRLTFVFCEENNCLLVALKRNTSGKVLAAVNQWKASPESVKHFTQALAANLPHVKVLKVPCPLPKYCPYWYVLVHLLLAMDHRVFRMVRNVEVVIQYMLHHITRSQWDFLIRMMPVFQEVKTMLSNMTLESAGLGLGAGVDAVAGDNVGFGLKPEVIRGGFTYENSLEVVSWNAYTSFTNAISVLFCHLATMVSSKPKEVQYSFPDIICLQEINDTPKKGKITLRYVNKTIQCSYVNKNSVKLQMLAPEKTRSTRQAAAVSSQLLPTYIAYFAEQTSFANKVDTHMKNIYILVKTHDGETETKTSVVAQEYYAIRKRVTSDSENLVFNYLKESLDDKTSADITQLYFSGTAPPEKWASIFVGIDNYIQESVENKQLVLLFPQSIHHDAEVELVSPLRARQDSSSYLQFRDNLYIRGVLCLKINVKGTEMIVGTIHNTFTYNHMVLAKYIEMLKTRSEEVPFFLIGDYNIPSEDWVNRKYNLHFLQSAARLHLASPDDVTSKNNKTIDYVLYSQDKLQFEKPVALSVPKESEWDSRLSCLTTDTQLPERKKSVLSFTDIMELSSVSTAIEVYKKPFKHAVETMAESAKVSILGTVSRLNGLLLTAKFADSVASSMEKASSEEVSSMDVSSLDVPSDTSSSLLLEYVQYALEVDDTKSDEEQGVRDHSMIKTRVYY